MEDDSDADRKIGADQGPGISASGIGEKDGDLSATDAREQNAEMAARPQDTHPDQDRSGTPQGENHADPIQGGGDQLQTMGTDRYAVDRDPTTIDEAKVIPEKYQEMSLSEHHKVIVAAIEEKINSDIDTLLQGREPAEVFGEMVSLGQDFRVLLSRLEGYAIAFKTIMDLKLGAFLDRLAGVAEKADVDFDEWLQANVRGISRRTVQDLIRLSRLGQIGQWSFMGKERLISVTGVCQKGGKLDEWKDNLIKHFLEHHRIQVGNDPANNFAQFRLDVDTAVNLMRLENDGIGGIDPEMVKDFTSKHGLLSRLHTRDLENVDDEGGDVQARFEELIGIESGKPPKEETSVGDKFKSQLEGFASVLKKAMKDPKALEALDAGTFRKFRTRIDKLGRKIAERE